MSSDSALFSQTPASLSAIDKEDTLERLALEREHNASLQSQVMTEFDQEIKGCERKFTVTDCKLDAMARKNAQMRELKQIEHTIKAQERAIKAADKQEALQSKQSPLEFQKKELQAQEHQKAFEQRMRDHDQTQQAHEAKSAGIPPTPMSEDDLQSKSNSRVAPVSKSLHEQTQAQEAYEKKQLEAKEHEAAVKKKLADKLNPAAPLPDPTLELHRKAAP
jgi:hypothetical protein